MDIKKKNRFCCEIKRRPQGDRRGALRRTCGQTDGNECVLFFFLFYLFVFLVYDAWFHELFCLGFDGADSTVAGRVAERYAHWPLSCLAWV